jgi:transposase
MKVSQSAVAKTTKRYDETGSHEDRHSKGRPRVNSLQKDKYMSYQPQIAAQINASEFK